MNFQDYISQSSVKRDLHESNEKPALGRISGKITLKQFEGAMIVLGTLHGEVNYSKPLAIKVTSRAVRFVWYDNNEGSYNISEFTAKHGLGDMPSDTDIPTFAEAKRML